jgi:hypothetical protein
LLVVVLIVWVESSTNRTAVRGSLAPEESKTSPVIDPKPACPNKGREARTEHARTKQKLRDRLNIGQVLSQTDAGIIG